MLVSPRGERPPIEYAESLVAAGARARRSGIASGLWTAVAVVLIVLAYAQPLYHLHTMARFPSQGFSPF